MTDRPKTLAGVLDAAGRYLADRQVQEGRRYAELLMSATVGIPILELGLRGETLLTEAQLDRLRQQTRRAGTGEPVQYILGEWDFMGHSFKVDSRALIPRPETECLVELVLGTADIWMSDGGRPCVLDVGTGSGCIAISLALARPDAAYVAVDVSHDALSLARENAIRHGLEHVIAFSHHDLAEILEPESVSAVVANLPYIPTCDCDRLPGNVRDFEPRVALDGGADGLDIIRGAIEEAAILLKQGGRIFLEIGAEQGNAVSTLMEQQGFCSILVKQDLTGRDRIVSAVLE